MFVSKPVRDYRAAMVGAGCAGTSGNSTNFTTG